MVDEVTKYPEEGDWVLVWGQIKRGATHPEDVLVEFFSHSEQYAGHVRVDRVVTAPADVPAFATRCTALFLFAGGDNEVLVRCARHDGHGKKHRDTADHEYTDDMIIGHIEES